MKYKRNYSNWSQYILHYGDNQPANKLPNSNCATGNTDNGKFTAGPWADPW